MVAFAKVLPLTKGPARWLDSRIHRETYLTATDLPSCQLTPRHPNSFAEHEMMLEV